MWTVDKLLDAAKQATGATSDKELATKLGIKPTAVSNYRRGVSLPDAVVCATLAGLTGEPLAKVLGVVGEARAISREEKAVWRKLAATAASLALGALLAFPGGAQAASRGFQASTDATLCEMVCRAWRYYVGLLRLLLERLLQRQLVLPPAKDATA